MHSFTLLNRLKNMRIVIFIHVIILLSFTSVCQANSALDGEWKFRERLCGSYSGQSLGCYSYTEYYTISDDTLYYEGEEVGSVTSQGSNIIMRYDTDYLKSAFENQLQEFGYEDITVKSANIFYRGTLRNNQIKGKIGGKVVVLYQGYTIPIKYTGNFKARKQ